MSHPARISQSLDTQAMRLVTYNLRYDAKPDNVTVQQSLDALPDPLAAPGYLRKSGEQPWSVRRLRVAEHLLGEGIVLAGFQEALVRQVHDLAELFGKGWDWVCLCRWRRYYGRGVVSLMLKIGWCRP
jgi:hypothetical protein